DYGVVNLFGQYLLDHYGVKVLGDSLKNNSKGVASLEQALIQNGINQSFGEIFSNFNLALFFNDCNLGEAYCFKNANLKNIKVAPALIILPNTQQTELSLRYQITDWSGNWYRLSMAGVADLGLNFEGDLAGQFKIPYAVCQANGTCSIANLELDEAKKGVINLSRFGEQGRYLVLAPTIQDLTVNSQTQAKSYNFNLVLKAGLSVATTTSSIQDSSTIILRAKILELEQQIILLKQKLAGNLDAQSGSCGAFLVNLKFGQVSSSVRCLQMFLQKQGLGIYPEGWVTGYFGLATQKAVIRFQEKYLAEILTPFGLTKGTGLVGTKTREKINAMR
ncbi:MAG: peptidoglycan-binding protein, partial [Candidatus Gribaldobacteria bacterium]|nr:peptidoglycan-binding protein [Candidatus Gribaldobacteria bacterium]